MMENMGIAAKILDAIFGSVIGIISEHTAGIAGIKAGKKLLERKIKKREAYLKRKYEKQLEFLNQINEDAFYDWLKEKRTIERILSFSNAADVANISPEQMRLSKECFFQMHFVWHKCMACMKRKS